MGRWITVTALAGLLSGCGLLLDLDPPDVDAGGSDGGGMDAGGVDAGRGDASMDAGPDCTNDDQCGPRDACGDHDICRAGRCVPNRMIRTCDDGIECTEDRCLPEGGCEHIPSSGPCGGMPDDSGCSGYRCDVTQGCVLTQIAPCRDEIGCTADACQLETGICRFRPVDGRCPGPSRCLATEPGTGCEDLACTSPSECPDDDPCVANWACPAGVCVAATNEPDGTTCPNVGSCAVTSVCEGGVCVAATTRDCGDMNPCTIDSCDPVEGCSNPPDTAQNGMVCPAGDCAVGQCNNGSCGSSSSTCMPNDALCETAVCNGPADCLRGNPCTDRSRVCEGDGTCGVCQPGRADCNMDGFCDRDVDADGPCPNDAGVPDGGPSDAGVSDSGSADASPPLDGGGCPVPTLPGGMCPAGSLDCNDDGCCDCNAALQTCSTMTPGACVPRCEGTSFICGALQECCCECVPMGTGPCMACPAGI